MPKYLIHTYGCQMNYSDSERMETYIEALGFEKTDKYEDADLVIFNTCSIKQKAEDKVFGEIRKLSKIKCENPNMLVVLAGCMVRISSSRYSEKRDRLFSRTHEIDIAIRTEELPRLAGLAREINPEISIKEIDEEGLEDYFSIRATHSSHQTHAQAFVAISNGCDKFCTYCIVPYSRGREKSRKMESILDEATKLVENGCIEITLIGQTVNSYGLSKDDKDSCTFDHLKKEPFVYLLGELDKLKAKGLKRVRFTSPHPKDMSDQLIDAMGSLETQMPYLHLPVQAGDDNVLKRMNRTYNTERFRGIVKALRNRIPDISITTDMIVGFCGETEEEFENTFNFFEEMGFEHAYISRYSERRGTVASKFIKDDISHKVKGERWHRLNNLLKDMSVKALGRFIGKTVDVLVEEQVGTLCTGRDKNYKMVQFNSEKDLLGKIAPVKIAEAKDWTLHGELL